MAHSPPFYSSGVKGFLGGKFDSEIKSRADGIVNATIEVYERISKELLPTPARYTARVTKSPFSLKTPILQHKSFKHVTNVRTIGREKR